MQHEAGNTSSSGRGRGRGRGRGSRTGSIQYGRFEDDPDVSEQTNHEKSINLENGANPGDSNRSCVVKNSDVAVESFDLNVDLNENGDLTVLSSEITCNTFAKAPVEMKREEYPGWSLADMKSMAIDPIELGKLNERIEEEEDDYDEEGS